MAGNSDTTLFNIAFPIAVPRILSAVAREMIDALGEARPKLFDRRRIERMPLEAAGFISPRDRQVVEIFMHDLNAYTLGFVSRTLIELGTRGNATMALADGGRFEIGGRVMRCREFKAGCFEGYLNFTTSLAMARAA